MVDVITLVIRGHKRGYVTQSEQHLRKILRQLWNVGLEKGWEPWTEPVGGSGKTRG